MLPPLIFRSVTAPKRGASFSLKVVKATVTKKGRGKPDFQPISQMYILGVIRKRWGAEYTLVTTDGIELEDSPATQGTPPTFSYYLQY